MTSPFKLWTKFAYRHRPASYLVALLATFAACFIYDAVLSLHGVTEDLLGTSMYLGGNVVLFIIGGLVMVFAIPDRSPWD